MAVFGGITEAQVIQLVTAKLLALRTALNDVADMHEWTAGLSEGDLVAIGFAAADADDILGAAADANAVAQIYTTGLPPGSYPQPGSAYVYAASQAKVIGPQ